MSKLFIFTTLLLISAALNATDATSEKAVGAVTQSLAQQTDEQRLVQLNVRLQELHKQHCAAVNVIIKQSLGDLQELYASMEALQTSAAKDGVKVDVTRSKMNVTNLQQKLAETVTPPHSRLEMVPSYLISAATVHGLTKSYEMDAAVIYAYGIAEYMRENQGRKPSQQELEQGSLNFGDFVKDLQNSIQRTRKDLEQWYPAKAADSKSAQS